MLTVQKVADWLINSGNAEENDDLAKSYKEAGLFLTGLAQLGYTSELPDQTPAAIDEDKAEVINAVKDLIKDLKNSARDN